MSKLIKICKQCGEKYITYKENSQFCSLDCKHAYNRIPYNCDYCNKEFIASRSKIEKLNNGTRKRLFCSKECADKAQYTSVKKTCLNCGENFTIFNCFKDIQKFCSKECMYDYKHKNAKFAGKLITCSICGKDFEPKNADTKYCSYECSAEAQRNRIECTCEYCGKPFKRIRSEVEKNKKHYCSITCKTLGMSWSKNDLEVLNKYFGIKTYQEISDLLDNRWDAVAVQRKAITLGLTSPRDWTNEELENMNYYSKVPMSEMLKILPNRTYSSILHKARELNMKSYFYLNNIYTESDEQYLKDNYLEKTNEELGEYLSRSPGAIAQKLWILGLYRPQEKYNYDTLNNYIRHQLYEWKNKYREDCNYTCEISGKHSNLVIHHIRGFNLLMNEVIEILNFPMYEDFALYTQNELDLLTKTFLELQEYYNQYICITEEIHKQFHSIYGYGYNTKEQWDEFIKKIL